MRQNVAGTKNGNYFIAGVITNEGLIRQIGGIEIEVAIGIEIETVIVIGTETEKETEIVIGKETETETEIGIVKEETDQDLRIQEKIQGVQTGHGRPEK